MFIRQKVKCDGPQHCPKSESWETQTDMTSCLTHSPDNSEALAGISVGPKYKKLGQKALWDSSRSFAQGSAGPFSVLSGFSYRKKPVSLSLHYFKGRPVHKLKHILEDSESSVSTTEICLSCM